MSKKRLAIIGAIEGTEDRLLERDCVFSVNTIKKYSKLLDYDIHLLQPTQHDVAPHTREALHKLDVNYHKHLADYNQPGREFNYTNMPIACDWFCTNISNEYEYFLWLDCDVLCRSPMILPEVNDSQLMYMYNNQFYSSEKKSYITFSSDDFVSDAGCYDDLLSVVGVHDGDYVATNSWAVYGKSQSLVWKEWNNITRQYINAIQDIGASNFLFYNKDKNFHNRVEELTLDIAIKIHDVEQVLPTGFHTFNSMDTPCEEFVETYSDDNHTIHYDKLSCVATHEHLLKYFDTPYIKALIYSTHGADLYKKILQHD